MGREPRPVLTVEEITVRFDGNVALDRVSLHVNSGELVGLIGPNGAGKSTLMNAVNGVVRPVGGQIQFDGQVITGLKPHRIARLGIGRTFQHSELFQHMTVLDNLLLGRHVLMRVNPILGGLFFGPARREEIAHRERVEWVVDFLELERYRRRVVSSLPYGVQKLVDLGRALAMRPKLLLLDEPSSGLNRDEKEHMARFLLRIRYDLGVPMLWVEHDMEMVRDLADRVYVLDYGHVIAHGHPEAALRVPEVVEAYLGAPVQLGEPARPS